MSYDATLGGGGWTVGDIKPPVQGAEGFPTAGTAGYPAGATPVHAFATGANAPLAPSLPGVAGKTTYITGFEITSGGATAAALGGATLSGVLGGSIFYIFDVPAGAALTSRGLIVTFDPPIPASALNTAIAMAVPATGAGNLQTNCALHGFQL